MHRRHFMALPVLSASAATQPLANELDGRIELDDTAFSWTHRQGRLFGTLSAPTHGWLAVGFNDEPTLRGTRFLIGVVQEASVRAELHIADPPSHRSIETLGGESDIRDLDGQRKGGQSILSFSLPHRSSDRFAVDLTSGSSIHLMLAWSHEPEFNHHSAWRRHANVTL